MKTTRDKLAACLGEHFHQSAYAGRTLDALEAIVREARNEAIKECAQIVNDAASSLEACKRLAFAVDAGEEDVLSLVGYANNRAVVARNAMFELTQKESKP